MGNDSISELLKDSLFTKDEIEMFVALASTQYGVRTEEEMAYNELYNKKCAIEGVVEALSKKLERTIMEEKMLEAYSENVKGYRLAFYRTQPEDKLRECYDILLSVDDLPVLGQISLDAIRDVMKEKGLLGQKT